MAATREIKSRIKSVNSTMHITKAMNLVAASKLQRAKSKVDSNRAFFNETRRVVASIVNDSKNIRHEFITQKQNVKNVVIILITGDRGLCGGYNTNVSRLAAMLGRETGDNVSFIVIGNKGRDFLVRRNKHVMQIINGISEKPFYDDAVDIGKVVMDLYKKGEADEVYLCYTEFRSVITHVPKSVKLLPVDTKELDGHETKGLAVMNFEPNPEAVLDYVIPKYINTTIYGALVESAACQQGARMTSMDSATSNAEKMIAKYTLQFNRLRQGAITQEISEIVSGANAL